MHDGFEVKVNGKTYLLKRMFMKEFDLTYHAHIADS
jgi:hypothetical protein